MAYFNYHAKAKNKIKQGLLLHYEVVNKWNNITPAMVLYFGDGTVMPIRQHRWKEYYELFEENNYHE